jgi:hypothetical protein
VRKTPIFAENWQKSQKIVIITSTLSCRVTSAVDPIISPVCPHQQVFDGPSEQALTESPFSETILAK